MEGREGDILQGWVIGLWDRRLHGVCWSDHADGGGDGTDLGGEGSMVSTAPFTWGLKRAPRTKASLWTRSLNLLNFDGLTRTRKVP